MNWRPPRILPHLSVTRWIWIGRSGLDPANRERFSEGGGIEVLVQQVNVGTGPMWIREAASGIVM